MFQKRIQRILDAGGIFEDFVNGGLIYCTKDSLKSMEASLLSSQRIEANFKVETRYSDRFSVRDRLLFNIEKGRTGLKHEEILGISNFSDPTGRREYLKMYALSGAYAGQAPVQPEENNRLLVKGVFTSDDLGNAYNSLSDELPITGFNYDLFVVGGSENNYIATNEHPSDSVFPVIATYAQLTTLKGKVGETEITFTQEMTLNDIKFWTARSFLIPVREERLIKFEIT